MERVLQLEACANWNADKGCAIFRQAHHEKNNAKQAEMYRNFARHMHNADACRREAFLLSRKRRH